MRKNDKKKLRQQRPKGQGPGSQLKLALGAFIRETLYETVLVAGLECVREVLEAERAEVCGPRVNAV